MISKKVPSAQKYPYQNMDPTQFLSVTVDQIFREANITSNGLVNYEEFVKIVCAPVPDYY